MTFMPDCRLNSNCQYTEYAELKSGTRDAAQKYALTQARLAQPHVKRIVYADTSEDLIFQNDNKLQQTLEQVFGNLINNLAHAKQLPNGYYFCNASGWSQAKPEEIAYPDIPILKDISVGSNTAAVHTFLIHIRYKT